ncbi:hypothetical protein GCM10022243_38130 [Saccharothrix violaceirubra]
MLWTWLVVPSVGASARILEPEPAVGSADIVLLVDESSSLSTDDVRREREAAAVIALGEFAPASRVAVVGFGSDNGASGQSAVDVVCPPTIVATAQERQVLSDCIGRLRGRTAAEGDGTDHYAALSQAMSYLSGSAADQKMIFLLTDGRLDVGDSEAYGSTSSAEERNKVALEKVDETLAAARAKGVTVWPLGFGTVDRAQLDRFAAGGHQGSCGRGVAKPTATVIEGSGDVVWALLQAYRLGRCAGGGEPREVTLDPGATAETTVDIPLIATDGSIVVVKQDPRLAVEYVDPDGRAVPKNGTVDDSTFQVSGENGAVEALRVVNPKPGPWTVRLKSFPNLPRTTATAVVTWQGAVRAVLTVDPPSPTAGQEVAIALALRTRTRPITDPAALSGLDFAVDSGFAGPVTLTDDGRAPDTAAGDGIHTGRATVPADAKGDFEVTGTVSGVGIASDTRSVRVPIATGPPELSATTSLDDTEAAPGAAIDGVVEVANTSGRARRVRLQLADIAPGTLVSVPGDATTFDVPPAGRESRPFRLDFADATPLGVNSFTLVLVDDEVPEVVIHRRQFTVDVVRPTPYARIGVVGGGVLVAVAALVAFVVWRRRRDVRGLVLHLTDRGRPRGDLAAPEMPARRFRFAVEDHPGGPARLEHTDAADAYSLTRVGGALRLHHPTGEVRDFLLGDRVALAGELSLAVVDERAAVVDDVPTL